MLFHSDIIAIVGKARQDQAQRQQRHIADLQSELLATVLVVVSTHSDALMSLVSSCLDRAAAFSSTDAQATSRRTLRTLCTCLAHGSSCSPPLSLVATRIRSYYLAKLVQDHGGNVWYDDLLLLSSLALTIAKLSVSSLSFCLSSLQLCTHDDACDAHGRRESERLQGRQSAQSTSVVASWHSYEGVES